jgi:hypothetical protein
MTVSSSRRRLTRRLRPAVVGGITRRWTWGWNLAAPPGGTRSDAPAAAATTAGPAFGRRRPPGCGWRARSNAGSAAGIDGVGAERADGEADHDAAAIAGSGSTGPGTLEPVDTHADGGRGRRIQPSLKALRWLPRCSEVAQNSTAGPICSAGAVLADTGTPPFGCPPTRSTQAMSPVQRRDPRRRGSRPRPAASSRPSSIPRLRRRTGSSGSWGCCVNSRLARADARPLPGRWASRSAGGRRYHICPVSPVPSSAAPWDSQCAPT